jgi:hypothetical protein
MYAKVLKDRETGLMAVFNPNSQTPVHVGYKYWFRNESELRNVLKTKEVMIGFGNVLFNNNGPIAVLFSWWEGTNLD